MGARLCNQCQTISKSQPSSIKIVTLNYGGILNNPFQFYSEDQQEEIKLSKIFSQLLKTYINDPLPKDFNWNIGKIDQKIQSQRYSPVYNKNVGLSNPSGQQKFVTFEEFTEQWNLNFEKASEEIKITPQPTNQQIQNMRLFDLICYHSILAYLYQINCKVTLDKIILSNKDKKSYKQFMERKFSKSFLDYEKKQKIVMKMLHDIDIAFLQQPSQTLINKIIESNDKFEVKHNGDRNSMIVLRKQKFLKQRNSLIKLTKLPELENLNNMKFQSNTDIVYLCVDKVILISAHLASSKDKNEKQVAAMKKFLNNINKIYPQCEIIFGADANSYVSKDGLSDNFNVFPQSSQTITTRKKRTFLQPQYKKADQVIQECKDHIITTFPIHKNIVQMINEKNQQKIKRQLLPTDKHPFDHFMVSCEINIEFN